MCHNNGSSNSATSAKRSSAGENLKVNTINSKEKQQQRRKYHLQQEQQQHQQQNLSNLMRGKTIRNDYQLQKYSLNNIDKQIFSNNSNNCTTIKRNIDQNQNHQQLPQLQSQQQQSQFSDIQQMMLKTSSPSSLSTFSSSLSSAASSLSSPPPPLPTLSTSSLLQHQRQQEYHYQHLHHQYQHQPHSQQLPQSQHSYHHQQQQHQQQQHQQQQHQQQQHQQATYLSFSTFPNEKSPSYTNLKNFLQLQNILNQFQTNNYRDETIMSTNCYSSQQKQLKSYNQLNNDNRNKQKSTTTEYITNTDNMMATVDDSNNRLIQESTKLYGGRKLENKLFSMRGNCSPRPLPSPNLSAYAKIIKKARLNNYYNRSNKLGAIKTPTREITDDFGTNIIDGDGNIRSTKRFSIDSLLHPNQKQYR